jgi:hypothetical protein
MATDRGDGRGRFEAERGLYCLATGRRRELTEKREPPTTKVATMGHQAIIYGRIQELWDGTLTRWPKTAEYNQGILEALPGEDDVWPYLTRHMFAVMPRAFRGNADRGEYRGRIIHFASSLKDSNGSADWPRSFLNKLEREVLSKLLWVSAKVHFESVFFKERIFVYRSQQESLVRLQAELEERRFGERTDVSVTWNCNEILAGRCEATWLY